MAYSKVTIPADGTTDTFTFSFGYLYADHIEAYKNGIKIAGRTLPTASSVKLNTSVANGDVIIIQRITPRDKLLVSMPNSGTFRGKDINAMALQTLYIAQEVFDNLTTIVQLAVDNTMDALNHRISNVLDPVNPQDAVTKRWAETAMDSELAQAIAAKNAAVDAKNASDTNKAGTAADRTQTGLDRTAVANDKTTVASDKAAVAANKTATDNNVTAAAGSASAASGSASTASNAASTATTQAGIATTKATQTATDAVATAADRVQTGLDRTAAAADAVKTNGDRYATGLDRVQTGLDRTATAADRVQTGQDRTAVANDKTTVANDKAAVASDKATVAADKATVAADKGLAESYRLASFNYANAASASATNAGISLTDFRKYYLGGFATDPTKDLTGATLTEGALYWNTVAKTLKNWNGATWVAVGLTTGGAVAVTPVGALVATNAQAAFQELDADLTAEITARIAGDNAKVSKSGDTMTGRLNTAGFTWGKSHSIAGVDLDTLMTAGFYSGPNLVNAPTNTWYQVSVQTYNTYVIGDTSTHHVYQHIIPINPGFDSWHRTCNAGVWGPWRKIIDGGNHLNAPDVIIEEQQPSGTNAGTFTSGGWQFRALNTVVRNVGNIASLASSLITLPAGSYYFVWSATGYQAGSHRTKIQDETNNVELFGGSTETQGGALNACSRSHGSGVATFTASRTVSLKHRCQSTKSTDGFGGAAGFSVPEVYSRLEIWKIA
ncbi:phage tail fiber protein [Hyphomicrobium sp. ghe19]|uniref:phage tail fiber domain-containing protein n=1 Tax=Hyphomicrobium sp. ghe19 TaxID=2682968 RepID=UPI001366AF96|nr:hypothetical protein HYPP_02634 [Hyphomicrobium sp. ghe19]